MTFRERTVVAILLLVAKIVNKDPAIAEELRNLANRIGVYVWKDGE